MANSLHDLTARERAVLDLIRLGLTNEEVAQRLGITLDGAKYHVSQILSKLGVATREEAATMVLDERRRWWAQWPLWAKIAGTATVAAAVAGLAVLAWAPFATPSAEEATRTIAPRPASSGWLTYRDQTDRFEFQYPGLAAPAEEQGLPHIDLPFVKGTNLERKFVELNALENAEECGRTSLSVFPNVPAGPDEQVELGGVSFRRQRVTGAAAAHYWQLASYSATRSGLCVSLTFVLESVNPGVFPSPPPEFDRAGEAAVFEQIASTFRWLES